METQLFCWKTSLKVLERRDQKQSCFIFTNYNYKGCISCFACKKKTGKSYGKCAVKDGLTSVLKKVNEADVIILGSPIYFGSVTGRDEIIPGAPLLSLMTYTDPPGVSLTRKVQTAFIYTLGATKKMARERGFDNISLK